MEINPNLLEKVRQENKKGIWLSSTVLAWLVSITLFSGISKIPIASIAKIAV